MHSHPYLCHRHSRDLVHDFILTNRELSKAAIVELKLPSPRLIRRQTNRERFASAVIEARAQLLRYRDWFRIPENRRSLMSNVGFEIYEPRLAVIVGRSSEFQDEFDRQRLAADNPDIEVVTYDDLLFHAGSAGCLCSLDRATIYSLLTPRERPLMTFLTPVVYRKFARMRCMKSFRYTPACRRRLVH